MYLIGKLLLKEKLSILKMLFRTSLFYAEVQQVRNRGVMVCLTEGVQRKHICILNLIWQRSKPFEKSVLWNTCGSSRGIYHRQTFLRSERKGVCTLVAKMRMGGVERVIRRCCFPER